MYRPKPRRAAPLLGNGQLVGRHEQAAQRVRADAVTVVAHGDQQSIAVRERSDADRRRAGVLDRVADKYLDDSAKRGAVDPQPVFGRPKRQRDMHRLGARPQRFGERGELLTDVGCAQPLAARQVVGRAHFVLQRPHLIEHLGAVGRKRLDPLQGIDRALGGHDVYLTQHAGQRLHRLCGLVRDRVDKHLAGRGIAWRTQVRRRRDQRGSLPLAGRAHQHARIGWTVHGMSLSARALDIACTLLWTASFLKIRFMCPRRVSGEISSALAASLSLLNCATV